MRALCAEFAGAFILVFAGTGAIVVNSAFYGVIGHVGISLVFGLAVAMGIVAFAEISGAHFNPAVTIGLIAAGRFEWRTAPPYILAQCAGAIAASGLLRLLFPLDVTLGATLPVAGIFVALCFEVIMTFILMATILGVAPGGRHATALAIGGAVAMDALFGGPISGASMNPARSLGPAVVAQVWSGHWIYWLAPVLGAVTAAGAYDLLFTPRPNPMKKPKVLFVCIHNSARSQMAEAFLNDICGENFEAMSAGLEAGTLNPVAVEAMHQAGIDISQKTTKRVFDYIKEGAVFAYVITVCDETSAERCPVFPFGVKRLHWSFPDPSAFEGSFNERVSRTIVVRDQIRAQISEWCAEVCVPTPA